MRVRLLLAFGALLSLGASPPATESGALKLYFLGRPVGEEHYTLQSGVQGPTLDADFSYTERGSTVALNATLHLSPDLTPTAFVSKGRSYRPFNVDAAVDVHGTQATVRETGGTEHDVSVPRRFFTISGYNPLSAQMMLLRYWLGHGRPARLPQRPGGDDLIISEAGRDVVTVDGARVVLTRYSIANLVWGTETVWLDPQNRIAAAATYAGNLPLEAAAPAYEAALPALLASSNADRFGQLVAWERTIQPTTSGRYAIVGVRLIDGTGAPPVDGATVIVEGGKIEAVGGAMKLPAGTRTVDGRGKTLLPGLWEMHAHFSQVDYGPAYLAAGVTTARDLGGEMSFLTPLRDLLNSGRGLGPHLLLACLVDGSGEKSFGTVYADTPDQGRAVVRRCKESGFVQMKIYDYIRPEVLRAITDEAHSLGMSVTGHVPHGMTARQAVLSGQDQINHLGSPLQEAKNGSSQPLSPDEPSLRSAVEFFRAHHTVIDPTQAWGELLGRPRNVPIESFEPGFAKAPYTLRTVIGSSGTPPSETSRWGMSDDPALLIRSLHSAGVPIVAGTDKALPAHSLHRELELYVEAGLTPMEVIQLATSGAAKVMGLDREVGTVAVGKRADLILVDGDPLVDFAALRKVTRVVVAGRMYDTADLWRSVGYKP